MNLTDELQRLSVLHRQGSLTDDEFARAKMAVLAGDSPAAIMADSGGDVDEQRLRTLEIENAIMKLDRAWEKERENYMVTGQHGHKRIPGAGESIAGAIVAGIAGLGFTLYSAGAGMPFVPLFGLLFTAVGVGTFVNSLNKATRYEEAERLYRERRAALTQQEREHRSIKDIARGYQ